MDPVLVAAFTLPLIAYGFGGRFYWANRTGYLHDTWYHLLVSEEIRDNTHRLPDKIDHFIFEGPYDYPPALHWVLSFLPEGSVRRYNWVISPTVEVLHGICLLFPVAYFVSGEISVALVAVAIYAITPELFRHFTSLTPRVIGSLLFSVVFLSTVLAVGGRPLYFVPAVLVGGLLLLTHKMSSQALAFTLVGFSLVEWTPVYVGVLLAIVAAAMVISGGRYVSVLRSHVTIINFWRIQRAKGNPPNSFMRDYGTERSDRSGSLVQRVKSLVLSVDPLMLIITNSLVIFLPVPLFLLGGFDTLSGLGSQIANWSVTILAIAIFTQYVPPLKLVGEGHKYFMWGTFPGAIVLAELVFELQNAWVLLAVSLFTVVSVGTIYFMMQSRVQSEHSAAFDRATDRIIPRLNEEDIERIMAVPSGGSYIIAYLTRKKILWHDSPLGFWEGEIYYPTPLEPLEDIAEDYDIDAIVVDTSQVRVDESDFRDYELTVKEGEFLLLEPRRLIRRTVSAQTQ